MVELLPALHRPDKVTPVLAENAVLAGLPDVIGSAARNCGGSAGLRGANFARREKVSGPFLRKGS
jgi:hypothetical protein